MFRNTEYYNEPVRRIESGISWDNQSPVVSKDDSSIDSIRHMLELEEDEEDIEIVEYPVTENTPIEEIKIGNRKLDMNKFKVIKEPIKTEKLTIYLNRNLIMTLKLLKKNKSIQSYSQCINDCLVKYLTAKE